MRSYLQRLRRRFAWKPGRVANRPIVLHLNLRHARPGVVIMLKRIAREGDAEARDG